MIFDLGFHKGDDTYYYLSKGYKVIAVEANPDLVIEGRKRFKNTNKLVLINKAISYDNDIIKFYIHPIHSDWSSCDKSYAERDGVPSKEVSVETISLIKLCEEYGTPYYLKVDIEGRELFVAEQLTKLKFRPKYVSFETGRSNYFRIILMLYKAGYRRFQLRNQLNNSKYSSGTFGRYLPKDKWLNYEEVLFRYRAYVDLKNLDSDELGLGWLDVHASL